MKREKLSKSELASKSVKKSVGKKKKKKGKKLTKTTTGDERLTKSNAQDVLGIPRLTKKELEQVISDDLSDMKEDAKYSDDDSDDNSRSSVGKRGRPLGAKGKDGSVKSSAMIRKAAMETGKMPMEIALDAARTGFLPRKGKTRRFLTTDQQMDMIKTSMNYFHPKVNPVFEDDDDNRSAFMKLFSKERVAALQPSELLMLEALMTKLVTGEQKPILAIEDKGKAVDAEFSEVQSVRQSVGKAGRPPKPLTYEDTLKVKSKKVGK